MTHTSNTTGPAASAANSALAGLRVLELGGTLPAAHTGQFLADFGADVVTIEPPGGGVIRSSPAFPFLARGKRSIVADLSDVHDANAIRELAVRADVLIESFRPHTAARLGIDHATLSAANPALVHASITGFGERSPLEHLQGYEALVMAKIGGLSTFAPMADRTGPAFVAVPYCSFSAGQTALHGILAALIERERSGLGQHVSTSLVQAIAAHDIWNWFLRILTERYAEAFTAAPHISDGVPNSALVFRLLVALSADGQWLQFSQTSRHLYVAFMQSLGLGWMFDDPDWKDLPLVEDPARRVELWDTMLTETRSRTLTEWAQVFDDDPNVWAEPFRAGSDLLDHPQMIHDRNVVTIVDPDRGPVRQPGPLVHMSRTAADTSRSAPPLGEHGVTDIDWPVRSAATTSSRSTGAPLAGVTILELGMFYAAPFAATLLADLGAQVIKVEPLDGEPLRTLASFPEVGAIKVLQGKQSIAVDINTVEGRDIVHRLAGRCDIVLQSFRAGVAERLGVDAATLHRINPDLIYLSAPGYGSDGPCGHRPAYAPTIAAASGIAWRLTGATMPADTKGLDLAGEKRAAVRLIAATNASFAQCDGLGALASASALLLGLLARDRGAGGQVLRTSMLASAAHANCEELVMYEGRHPTPSPGPDLFGLSALYRLYRAADDWIFLASPTESDWKKLTEALRPDVALDTDARFHTSALRLQHDDDLARVLEQTFAARDANHWEQRLARADVGCAAVAPAPVEARLLTAPFGRASNLIADVEHPMLGEHPRLAPLVTFSRSLTEVGPGCMLGQHTDAVLASLGFDAGRRDDLRARSIIGG